MIGMGARRELCCKDLALRSRLVTAVALLSALLAAFVSLEVRGLWVTLVFIS